MTDPQTTFHALETIETALGELSHCVSAGSETA